MKYDQTDKYRLVADKHTFIILKVFFRSKKNARKERPRLKSSFIQILANCKNHFAFIISIRKIKIFGLDMNYFDETIRFLIYLIL